MAFGKETLPGESEKMFSSARPAARAFYLLHAAALEDKLSTCLQADNDCSSLKAEYEEELQYYLDYTKIYPRFREIVDKARESKALMDFLASGYAGKLKPEILRYTAMLYDKIYPGLRKALEKSKEPKPLMDCLAPGYDLKLQIDILNHVAMLNDSPNE
ncbi:MAG: hypothetical protein OEZ39_15615 [Gammaproteobacteria bacterium]|nr:hypothetical protein [Gammaproteobacteria bacterium]MDH5653284.1 hypothetical protein [Gammaproteobacteria bacterium]